MAEKGSPCALISCHTTFSVLQFSIKYGSFTETERTGLLVPQSLKWSQRFVNKCFFTKIKKNNNLCVLIYLFSKPVGENYHSTKSCQSNTGQNIERNNNSHSYLWSIWRESVDLIPNLHVGLYLLYNYTL